MIHSIPQIIVAVVALTLLSCTPSQETGRDGAVETTKPEVTGIPVIFDTDANNELDDQHALAYLLLNGQDFDVRVITVNTTYNGGNIEEQYAEAERVLKLTTLHGQVPLLKGADGNFEAIRNQVTNQAFDGAPAVNFIIEEAKKSRAEKLVLLAVGKLTNVALAVQKDPSIVPHIRLVWLGSNYPEPGEYNQDNDTASLNYLLNGQVQFEMVTVRYGKPSGTDAVRAFRDEINQRMPGKGPQATAPVMGRHGDSLTNFGDYSVNLFSHIELHGTPPSRALFDMAAVAIVKNAQWADSSSVPAPLLQNNKWVERPNNPRKIVIWENFNQAQIMADFYQTFEDYTLAGRKQVP